METVLLVIQIVLAILLTGLILIQSKGSGISRSWKSSATAFTRRGLEKVIFRATFVVMFLFTIISILQFVN